MLESGNIKIDRYNPPLSKELPAFKFPAFNTMTLDNGINVYIIEDSAQPLVSCRLVFNRGAVSETIEGLAGFTSQLMLRGTGKRSAAAIAEETELTGISLNSSSGWDDSSISMIGLSTHFEKGLEIISDCLFNSVFAEEEIDRLKKKHISNIYQEYADPNYLVQAAFNSTFFKGHPYGHPAIGTTASIDSLQRDQCMEWYHGMINDTDVFVILSGDTGSIKPVKLLNKHLDGLKSNKRQNPTPPLHNREMQTMISIVNKPDISQTTLKMGKPAIDRSDPDFSLMQLVNTIFGGYFLSRLNYSLREVHGYTYGIHSTIESRKHFSALTVGTNINKDATSMAVEEIVSEMSKISQNPVSEEELYRASQYVLGSFVRGVETPQQISTLIHSLIVNGLEPDYYNNFFNSIAGAGIDDLMKIQEKYFKPEYLVISAVGEQDFLTNALERFGRIEICDESGSLKK